jgi:hypothetical protein
MPDPTAALIVGGAQLASGILGASAAGEAAETQAGASAAGIAEQRRQFDETRRLLAPYVEAGTPALAAQQALLGLRGAPEQQAAISALETSPLFRAAVQQGEEALLQRASATGGLRGGNIQAALAQFRPSMLQQAIASQYQNLGGMTALGQRSAAGLGAAGMGMGENVSNLLAQQAQAQAGGQLAQAGAFQNLLGIPSQLAGLEYGLRLAGRPGLGIF